MEEIADTLRKSLDDSGYVEIDVYLWFVEGSRYPVFETVESRRVCNQNVIMSTRTAYLFRPAEQRQQLGEEPQQELKANTPAEIQEIKTHANISIYPNPVKDQLKVAIQLQEKQPVQIFLYDMQGQTVYKGSLRQAKGSFTETIGMEHLPQGHYVLRIQAGNGSVKKVVVKQ
jgi:hypothetical protein